MNQTISRVYLLIIFLLIIESFGCGSGNTGYSQQKSTDSIVIDREYYTNGKIKIERSYLRNQKGYVTEKHFDSNGTLEFIGHPRYNLRFVGPMHYYDSSGHLSGYNEIDFNGKNYYAIFYDSDGNVTDEEGMAISNTCEMLPKSDTVKLNYEFSVGFLYAEPDGYRNELTVTVNDLPYKYDKILSHHLLSVWIESDTQGEKVICIRSKLLDKTGEFVFADSVSKRIVFR